MKGKTIAALGVVFLALCGVRLRAQQTDSRSEGSAGAALPQADAGVAASLPATGTVVPRLVQFSGVVTDATGRPATGKVTLTFSLYELPTGGTPLWSETQSLELDSQGHYTVLLGAASANGLPLDLFTSGAARWLGVQPQLAGVGELPRTLLVGVPYALKAADADTLGGKPASAYVTTESQAGVAAVGGLPTEGSSSTNGPRSTSSGLTVATNGAQNGKATNSTTITGSGTANYVPLWTSSTSLGNSAFYQSGGNVGIGTTAPVTLFQVNGGSPFFTTGSGAGFEFQMRDSLVTSQWYGKANVARFWRSDIGDVIGVTSTGSVGIGTTSPSTLLQVNGSSPIYSTGPGAGLEFQMRDGTVTSQWYGKGNVSRFWRSDKGDILGVTSTGNVGIGTTAPAATLEVNGTSKFDQPVTFASGQTFPGVDSVTGVDGSPVNPMQVALLRWYPANQASTGFTAGTGPCGVAFDGASIWVANNETNKVTKLRASDGFTQGTFSVGTAPNAVAFDGANIWVVDGATSNVTKLRASDGTTLGTFAVGVLPEGVAFDGANIWVTSAISNNVTKLRASDGTTLGTFAVGTDPVGVAFDGANIWVTNDRSDNVTKLRASDGTVLGTFSVGAGPIAVAFDGANVWVVNQGNNNVTKLRASDGTVLGTFSVGASPIAVAFDGANVWVVNQGNSNVTKLRASDGTVLGTFSVGADPIAVAFDGANIWVTNFLGNTVSKL